MELPITRPSQMSYGDEINFSELLGELKSKKYNGFIRVTSGSSEGYILFNEGIQSASSFDEYTKTEALEKIKSTVDDRKTLIELFDLKKSQMKYLMDLNKFFSIDPESKVEITIDELKRAENNAKINSNDVTSATEDDIEPKETLEVAMDDARVEESPEMPVENIKIEESPVTEVKSEPKNTLEENDNDENEVKEKLKAISAISKESPEDKNKIEDATPEIETSTIPTKDKPEEIKAPVVETLEGSDSGKEIEKSQYIEENEFVEPGVEAESVDREELMKKYGLKDVGEEEVDNILETYKGGTLSDDDVEKIELTLMNKVKKSILGIPKIRGSEVMVFLDNTTELTGTINIISEYESKGLLSRIRGESRDLENLRRQIMNITQMEIKKSFRGYPEIVDDFEINVEIS